MRKIFFVTIGIFLICQNCFGKEIDFSGKKEEEIVIKKPQKELRVGENFIYKVKWMGVPVGYASLEVKEIVNINNQRCYHLIAKAYSNEFLSRFYKVEDVVHSYVDVSDFKTIKFEKYQQEGKYKSQELKEIDQQNKDARDPLCLFYYFRTQDVALGENLNFKIFADEKNSDVEIKVLKTERIELLRKGAFDCFVVEPVAKFRGLFVKRGKVIVYFTVDEKRIPIIIKMHTSKGIITGTIENL